MIHPFPIRRVGAWLAAPLCAGGLHAAPPPPEEVAFHKIILRDDYVSEGASIGDLDDDGHPDVVAGPLWWRGPELRKAHSYAPVTPIIGPGFTGYAENFFIFPHPISDDRWPDVLKIGLPGKPSRWVMNPGADPLPPDNEDERCPHHPAQAHVCHESPQLVDVIGDGEKELLAFSGGRLTLGVPSADPDKAWERLPVSHHDPDRFPVFLHGLGAGDVDGDGRTDILERTGWWEQPADWDRETPWTIHEHPFAAGKLGGAQMFAYDVDGDGDADVVTALDAHGYGFAWHEQIETDGRIDFRRHDVMTEKPGDNPRGVSFSQPHAVACADIDGDGVKDFVTGKCHYAHNGRDPGARGASVLYWFRTVRHGDGSAELVPHLIDDHSGVGRQISAGDLNGDGRTDLVVANKKGVFAFLQTTKDDAERSAPVELMADTFVTRGPEIRYGRQQGKGFIGWWTDMEGVATVPFEVSGEGEATRYRLSAEIAAAAEAGGTIRLALSRERDPDAEPIRTWTREIPTTGSWHNFRRVGLGSITVEEPGEYFLHLVPERMNPQGLINLVSMRFTPWRPTSFTIEGGETRTGRLREGNDPGAEARSPAEQLEAFHVPDGFEVELVASEAQGVVKPISLAFDDAGRLWTQTAREYPGDKDPALFREGGRDRILVIDHPERDGPRQPRVFAEDLAMPISVLPHDDGVLAIHGPDLLLLEDRDGDGKADHRRTLVSGFGIQDTHTMVHQLARMPGGWVYFSQGCNTFGTATDAGGNEVPLDRSRIGRVRPDGTDLQVIGAGMNNIWAWALTREGRVYIHEANDLGFSQAPFERDATYPSFVNTLRYPESMKHPPTAQGLDLGGSGFSGIAVSEGPRQFPGEWGGLHFVANPITGEINTVSKSIDGDGVHHFEKEADLLTCDDPMFRPVAVRFGPDGCLYVVDWYNRIISHNEVPIDHPARDKVSGRIWRIRHESQKDRTVPNVEEADAPGLLGHLRSGETWRMRAAWHQIGKRGAGELVPGLKEIILDGEGSDSPRIHALWCLESLGHFDEELWRELLTSGNPNVRYEAVRALSTLQPDLATALGLLRPLGDDPSFRVKNEVVRFFRDTPQGLDDAALHFARSFRTPEDELPKETVKGWGGEYLARGGPYEKAFLNLLVDRIGKDRNRATDFGGEERWNRVIAEHPEPSLEEIRETRDRIEHLVSVFEQSGGGDAAKGRVQYDARCATCHSTEPGEGGFAPSLSGGANRSPEALLTAMLQPNAATEAVFHTYRVVKKDGSVIEGFRSALGPDGVTLTFMGGGTMTVPFEDIDEAGYVKGKSVMPEGLIADMDEQGIVDLLTYLRSIP